MAIGNKYSITTLYAGVSAAIIPMLLATSPTSVLTRAPLSALPIFVFSDLCKFCQKYQTFNVHYAIFVSIRSWFFFRFKNWWQRWNLGGSNFRTDAKISNFQWGLIYFVSIRGWFFFKFKSWRQRWKRWGGNFRTDAKISNFQCALSYFVSIRSCFFFKFKNW